MKRLVFPLLALLLWAMPVSAWTKFLPDTVTVGNASAVVYGIGDYTGATNMLGWYISNLDTDDDTLYVNGSHATPVRGNSIMLLAGKAFSCSYDGVRQIQLIMSGTGSGLVEVTGIYEVGRP